jgi:hypothetical protein
LGHIKFTRIRLWAYPLPVNLNDECTREMELEKENRELKLRHEQEMKGIREEKSDKES